MKSKEQLEREIVELEKKANMNKSGNPKIASVIFKSCTAIANSGVSLGLAATNTLVNVTKACLRIFRNNGNGK